MKMVYNGLNGLNGFLLKIPARFHVHGPNLPNPFNPFNPL
jgi:hypothetical protein